MTRKTILPVALSFLALLPMQAQNNNGQDQGTVTVSQSKELDDLVFGKGKKHDAPATPGKKQEEKTAPVVKPSATTAPATGQQDGMTVSSSHVEAPAASPRPHVSAPASSYDSETVQNMGSGRKVMRHGFKMQGYRVQVFAGGNKREDRVKAQDMGKRIKAAFPNQPVYTHFHSPRWTCRIGNFRKYETAERIVKQARSMGFHQACIVSEKITVQDR